MYTKSTACTQNTTYWQLSHLFVSSVQRCLQLAASELRSYNQDREKRLDEGGPFPCCVDLEYLSQGRDVAVKVDGFQHQEDP
jgi:uncharacterized Fe-S cluster-containing radical SAM superfamily protein